MAVTIIGKPLAFADWQNMHIQRCLRHVNSDKVLGLVHLSLPYLRTLARATIRDKLESGPGTWLRTDLPSTQDGTVSGPLGRAATGPPKTNLIKSQQIRMGGKHLPLRPILRDGPDGAPQDEGEIGGVLSE